MDKSKILVVEDDPDILETIRFSLEAEGYDVTTAVDGEDGLNRAKQIRPDLMILDVMMPKINGYRVSQMIKEEKPSENSSKKPSVMLLTARNLKGDPDREKMFMNFSQADVMMYKPFEMDDLVKKINELLKQR
jgi:DNA-binding response OmpR family regulator